MLQQFYASKTITKEAFSHDFADGKGVIKLKKPVEKITDKNGFREAKHSLQSFFQIP